ncbi:MAG: DUF815 domain-containing protein [Deferribacterales bacterium]|nr:DUF815 domain-containing protein [Deferribacterales bacterium]
MLKHPAYRYIGGELEEAVIKSDITLEELISLSDKVLLAEKNITSFLSGGPYLNMLFWGEKGSGKSTLLRALTLKYSCQGLVAVEYMDSNPAGVYGLYKIIRANPDNKFIIYFDDISFDNGDSSYKRFKSIVEGGLEEKPENTLFAATSNKRHLVADSVMDTEDIYNRDEINEKTSLHTRFGLSIGFYPLSKDDYLKICNMYFDKYSITPPLGWEKDAEAFAIDRGGRSGRLAKQFAAYIAITN